MFPWVFLAGLVAFVASTGSRTEFDRAHVDPVCGMEAGAAIHGDYSGETYYFCSRHCRDAFLADPRAFDVETCLVCASEGRRQPAVEGTESTFDGQTYRFCSQAHRHAFQADPAGYFLHTMWGIPDWLYYTAVAGVLVLTFGLCEVLAREGGRGALRLRSGQAPGQRGRGERIRFDLLRVPGFRRIVVHPATRFVAQAFVTGVFLLILAAGLFGSQLPSRNIAPLLTWTVWWGGLILLVLYAGKAWCYVCPWDAIASWAEGVRLWGVRREGLSLGLRWPKVLRNIWPATALFVGLTWVEIGFGVTMSPRATAWLGLAMAGMAFVSAFLFDRKSFCRYGCLVGRVSGLYALFSPVEVRARDAALCRSCRTHSCFHGNERGEPCPTFQYVATMDQNTYCISCLECVKSCELGNVAVNLRPWGADLNHHARPRADEAYLALLLLSLTAFHGLTMTGAWSHVLAWTTRLTGLGETAGFTLGMAAVVAAPTAVYAGLVALSRVSAGNAGVGYRGTFVRYAYALLPIALFYHLAHNSEHLLMEGQKLAVLGSDPFGWGWDLFGTAQGSPAPIADLATVWGVQVTLVVVGHLYSLHVARTTASRLFGTRGNALRSQLPMLSAVVAFSLLSLWLLKQPMVMRTSAM